MRTNIGNRESKIILGFIVEGQTDALFIKQLASDYFQDRFVAEIVIMSGKASLASSSKIVISSFMQIGVEHVFILFDTDNQDIENQKNYLITPIQDSGLIDNVTIVPVDPMLETWILSSSIRDLNSIKKMDLKSQKSKLKELGFSKAPIGFANLKLDFNSMAGNNPDFKRFIDQIEDKIASYQHRI